MEILVTGEAELGGSSSCIKLKEKYPHYVITAFDNLKRRGSELSLIDFKNLGIGFILGDFGNREDLADVGNSDFLIGASAEPPVLAGLNSIPTYFINNNLYGSINCFSSCLTKKTKLIFLSTRKQVRDLLNIGDLISLIDTQIHGITKFTGKIFNAAEGLRTNASQHEMSGFCQQITGSRLNIDAEKETRPAALKIYTTDISATKEEVGREPKKYVQTIFSEIFNRIHENETLLMPILK